MVTVIASTIPEELIDAVAIAPTFEFCEIIVTLSWKVLLPSLSLVGLKNGLMLSTNIDVDPTPTLLIRYAVGFTNGS